MLRELLVAKHFCLMPDLLGLGRLAIRVPEFTMLIRSVQKPKHPAD
jgi:hypothetical protein